MDRTYWYKQGSEPLYPDLIWSKPENKQHAGKLLIIGGNIHGFASVGQAYTAAQKAGIGQIRIILPDILQKTVSKLMPEADFAPSSPSGGFSQKALAQILDESSWSDGVLVSGDLGRNSETAMLLEKLANKYVGQLTLSKDAADYITNFADSIRERKNTLLVISLAQLQLLSRQVNFPKAFTFDMGLLRLVDILHEFSSMYKTSFIVKYIDSLVVAVDGEISTTKTELTNDESWRVPVAATSAVWWLQNPSMTFEALTISVV